MSINTDLEEKKIIDRLKLFRKEKNLSQMQLSIDAGVSISMINYIEAGKRTPTLTTLLKLCSALDINPSKLFTPLNEEKQKIKTDIHQLIESL